MRVETRRGGSRSIRLARLLVTVPTMLRGLRLRCCKNASHADPAIVPSSLHMLVIYAGVIECVGIAIMVGLAVDYIVHMSAAIAHCDAGGPAAVQAALRNVGMSVVSGAVTTIGASMFLLPCEMAVFQQFGAHFLLLHFSGALA